MKVAISFIGTNKYLDYLPQYYENIEKYFLPNSEKTILAFTDGELEDTPDNLKVYHQEHLPWPYITLKRFEIINKAREEIKKNDWFVFIDADALPVATITEEEFLWRCCEASTDQVPLFGVHHPCHYLMMPPHNELPGAFDQNPKSEAYVDFNNEDTPWKMSEESTRPRPYYQGCFWGGQVSEVCAMIDELELRTNKDLEQNVVALWHDESHINRYFLDNPDIVYTFGSEYAYPELFSEVCFFEPKIVHLKKNNSEYQQ